jgi:hypothetical protein
MGLPANEYLQYFSREAMKKEKEKNSGIEQLKYYSREARRRFSVLLKKVLVGASSGQYREKI